MPLICSMRADFEAIRYADDESVPPIMIWSVLDEIIVVIERIIIPPDQSAGARKLSHPRRGPTRCYPRRRTPGRRARCWRHDPAILASLYVC